MTQVAQLISVDGEVTEVRPKDGRKFSLTELQGYVEGYIEHVKLPNGRSMYVNEEGKLNHLKFNQLATAVSGLYPFDVIVGPALVISDGETFQKLKVRMEA